MRDETDTRDDARQGGLLRFARDKGLSRREFMQYAGFRVQGNAAGGA